MMGRTQKRTLRVVISAALLLAATSQSPGHSARFPGALIFLGLATLVMFFLFQRLYLLAKHWRLSAVVEERAHLAHEIHDTLAQGFAGIGYQLQAIRNNIPPNSSALQRQVDLALELVRQSHDETRRSIASLRPETLDAVGLLPALRASAERMINDGKVNLETVCEGGAVPIPSSIKATLFRIGQEAIANSIRHADAGAIRIRLRYGPTSLCLTVEDDGTGFVPGSDCGGFGLAGMRKRAESISATFRIKSAPGAGTQVEVRTPVRSRFEIVAWTTRLFSL